MPPRHWATIVARVVRWSLSALMKVCAVAAGLRVCPLATVRATMSAAAHLRLAFSLPDVRIPKMKMKEPAGRARESGRGVRVYY